MAATRTTLAAAVLAGDQSIQVTSATGFAKGYIIMVDGEYMEQSGDAVGTVIPVQRVGQYGSVVSAHAILAPVVVGLKTDFPGPQQGWSINPAPYKKVIVSYGANGAIVPPTCDTLIFLTKATAAAMTIASPTAATPDGVEITIYSQTAAAHTVTYTPGINGDTTASDVLTFAATIGNSITLLSSRGVWGAKCAYGVTAG